MKFEQVDLPVKQQYFKNGQNVCDKRSFRYPALCLANIFANIDEIMGKHEKVVYAQNGMQGK